MKIQQCNNQQTNRQGFGTVINVHVGNRASQRALAKDLAESLVGHLSEFGAKIIKIEEDKGGDVLVRTNVTSKRREGHVGELQKLRAFATELSQRYNMGNTVDKIKTCVNSAGVRGEYHQRIAFDILGNLAD